MKPLPVEFHPDAEREAVAARQWYAERSESAAAAFVAELDAAVDRVSRLPDLYPVYLYGTRFCVLRRFPYIVVYRRRARRIQVVAVAHGRRKPGYWRKRRL